MPVSKTHPQCTIHEDGLWLPLWLDYKKRSPTQKSHQKLVNPRDIAGKAAAEEEDRKEVTGLVGLRQCDDRRTKDIN